MLPFRCAWLMRFPKSNGISERKSWSQFSAKHGSGESIPGWPVCPRASTAISKLSRTIPIVVFAQVLREHNFICKGDQTRSSFYQLPGYLAYL